MSRILFLLFIKPLSFLPLSVLYAVANALYLIIYYIIGYRKKVVSTNLKNSFPEKNTQELLDISKKFYRHLADMVVESLRFYSMPESEIIKRCRVTNPEVLHPYFDRGQSLIVVCGHYNNWEWLTLASAPQTFHQFVGIYARIKNPFFDHLMIASRSRTGMHLISQKDIRKAFESYKKQGIVTATVFAADQSPSNVKRAYWTTFLQQDTAVFRGPEKLAKDLDYPVVFCDMQKVKRGYYEMSYETLVDNPKEAADGLITELYIRRLEKQILHAPQYWLWTHKRWKREKSGKVREHYR